MAILVRRPSIITLPKPTVSAPTGPQLFQAYIWGATPTTSAPETSTTFKFRPHEKTGAGNRVLFCLTYSTGTAPTISDTAGNTWPGTPTRQVTSGGNDTSLWDLKNIAGGSFNTITVTFGGATQTPSGEYWEWSGLSTSAADGGFASNSSVTGTSLSMSAPFTPSPNNDGNGGYLIAAFFHDAFGNEAGPTGWVADASPAFTLMQGDTLVNGNFNQGQPMASEYFVQPAAASINPSMTATANAAGTFYNCITIALPLSPGAGTPPPNQLRINKVIKQRSPNVGTVTSVKTNFPTVGNCRVIASTAADNVLSGATDSDGTYVQASTTSFPVITVLKNKTADPTNVVTFSLPGVLSVNFDVWMFDISGAATGTAVGATAHAGPTTTGAAQTSVTDQPDITPTSITSLIIESITNGQGPCTAITSPAGAILTNLTLSSGSAESDAGVNSGDGVGVLHNTSLSAQAWNWTIFPPGGSGSDVSSSAVEILSA